MNKSKNVKKTKNNQKFQGSLNELTNFANIL